LYIDCEKDELRICHGVRPAKDREDREWIVYVDKSSARAVEEVYFVRRTLLRLSLVTAPLAMAIGFWAARRVTLPIENLRDEALKKALSESPGSNLTEHSDEVGDLAEALNTLLGALEKRRAENEAFVGDVVHEMKSPVAAITAVAEALEGPLDRARQERLSRALGASAKKLDALVSQFLDLAKIEAGMAREARETVDLGKLASEVRFLCETEGNTAISGVERRLEALVAELVDNAASFTPRGGAVRVRVAAKPGAVELVVEDEGPGIPEADAAKVFDRFFTTRGEKRGTGLGLALVLAVAQAHGGSARASARDGQRTSATGDRPSGAVFTVTFPRAAST
jgi:two-component system sensor histidine kinase ChvG